MNLDFYDWGSWGITGDASDLYHDVREMLEKALESGEDFDTGWHGFKKELESMRVRREGEKITVYVSAEMDSCFEEPDLIYDCLTDEEAEKLTDEMIESIREELMWADFVEESGDEETFPAYASLSDIMTSAKYMIGLCNERLHESFLMCMAITLNTVYGDPEDKSFIDERLKNAR